MVLALLTLAVSFTVDPAALVSAADTAFYRIEYPAALAAYEEAQRQAPDDPRILWRLARVRVCMGEVEEDARIRDEHFLAAERLARRCVAVAPGMSEGYTWLAGALGYIALSAGMSDQVHYAREILETTDKALALNPSDDASYSIRGSLYRALGNTGWLKRQLAALLLGEVPDGGFEEGEAALRTAISLAPDIMRHHYELGILYRDWGRPEDARRVLTHAATLDIRTAIDRPRKAKILQILAGRDE